MPASDLIGRLALAGVRLSVIGPGKLAAAPREALTEELVYDEATTESLRRLASDAQAAAFNGYRSNGSEPADVCRPVPG